MKRTLLLLALITAPAMAFAQGTVVLQNQTGRVNQWTSVTDSTLINVPVDAGYVALFAAPQGTPLPNPIGTMEPEGFKPNYQLVSDFLGANPGWLPFTTTDIAPLPGIFSGGNVTLGNLQPGADADYFFVGWTGLFNSYETALSAALADPGASFIGVSDIFTTPTADPTLIPPEVPVSLKYTFGGMTLATVIPEPTAFALTILGVAALTVIRRPK